jgi:hypothetical protein
LNIFVLDKDPEKAAKYQCDKHVIKMILETAQLLCSVFEPGQAPYKRTHYNHPSAVWTRASRANYMWLIEHGEALCYEYTRRYNKTHKSEFVFQWCRNQSNTRTQTTPLPPTALITRVRRHALPCGHLPLVLRTGGELY